MTFGEAIKSGFTNYVGFSGRAARSEFWYWVLFGILIGLVGGILDSAIFPDMEMGPFGSIISLVMLLPGIAMGVRRLHDIDRTGWWTLIALTGVGIILLIVWACIKGTPGLNRFGPDPLPSI